MSNAAAGTDKKDKASQTQPPKQRNSMAWRAEGAHFSTCVGVIFSVKRCGPFFDKKETIFTASGLTSGLISHLDLALRRTSTSDHLGFPKRSLQNSETAWPGELCNLHLQLPLKYTVGTFGCVWVSRPAKPRLLTQKPSQKGCLRNRETAWPGELNDTVFRPALE